MKELKRICVENEMLLIFDEVQSGMGITGKMWAHEHYGMEPDIISFGKKSQVCGIMAGARIDEVENNVFKEASRINSTWGGNLADMVRATRYLEIIEEDNLVQNAEKMGAYFMQRLKNMGDKITAVRGKGLMLAFDLENTKKRDEMREKLYDNHIIILPCGEKSLRVRPFLDITKSEIDYACDEIEKLLKNL